MPSALSPSLWASLMLVLALSLSACAERETAEPGGLEEQEGTAEEEVGLFGNWDTDANSELTYDEWNTRFQDENYYSDWNANSDDALTEQEFQQGLRGFADADNDGTIAEEEFNEIEYWFENVSFSDWDADGNNEITEEEWTSSWEEVNFWEDWDLDTSGDLTQDEFNEGVFGVWDENGDDMLTENEFNQRSEAFGLEQGMNRGGMNRGTGTMGGES